MKIKNRDIVAMTQEILDRYPDLPQTLVLVMLEQFQLIDAELLAKVLNVTKRTIHTLTNNGSIPFIQVGLSKRYQLKEVIKVLRENTKINSVLETE